MTRIRAAAGVLAGVFAPESGEEACVIVGCLLLAAAFLVAGLPALSLGVPGAIYVAVGLGFKFGRRA